MCNRYEYEGTFFSLAGDYQATPIGELENSGDVLPRQLAPGLLLNADSDRELHPMQFAFCPPGCKTPSDPKRALNNARVESRDKWPWKFAFKSHHCVLPLTAFREPSYWGDPAGTEVYFHRPDNALLHVAGIYRLWESPSGDDELLTLAFLMRPACAYVMEKGHHRQPLFITEEGIDAWLEPQDESAASLDVLRDYAAEPELTHRHARNMAESWTKRQKAKLKKRDKQQDELDRVEFVCGF